jgi:hypothetical protein
MPASCVISPKGSLVRPQACQVALHSSLRTIVPDYLVASLGKDLGNPNYPATSAPTGRCRMLYTSTYGSASQLWGTGSEPKAEG